MLGEGIVNNCCKEFARTRAVAGVELRLWESLDRDVEAAPCTDLRGRHGSDRPCMRAGAKCPSHNTASAHLFPLVQMEIS